MQEVRFHGRGGQGAVTGAYLLGHSAVEEGLYAQAFPNFGVERTGAPLEAYVRMAREQIRLREQISEPDYLIIQDKTLLSLPATFAGTDESTIAFVNADKIEEKINFKGTVFVSDITKLAVEILGRPIFNTAMLGFFAGVTKLVSLESLEKAVKKIFPPKLQEPNMKLIGEAYKTAPKDPVKYGYKAAGGKNDKKEKIEYSVKAGSTMKNETGSWRLNDPVVDNDKCINCGNCIRTCPENCIYKKEKGVMPDLEYCKGCGLCANVCPVAAIRMGELGEGNANAN